MDKATLSMIIFVVILILFALNKMSMAVTAMIGTMILLIAGCLEPSTVISNFATPTILLLGAIFIIAGAFSKTQTVNRISELIVKLSRGSEQGVIVGFVILSLITVSLIASSSAVFSIVWMLALACCKEIKMSPSKLALPIGIICIATPGIFPTVSAVAMCETWRPFFASFNLSQYADYTIMDYCLSKIPVTVLAIIYAIFYVPKHMPERISVESLIDKTASVGEAKPKLTTVQEIITDTVFVCTIVGVALSDKIGIPSWMICMAGALIVLAAGVLKGTEIYNNMGLSVLFLIIGGTCIAASLQQTGAAEMIGQAMLTIFGNKPNPYFFGAVFFLVPHLLTQIMSDGAVNQIFVPLCLMACQAIGGNPVGPLFLVITGACTAYITPMANPASVLYYNAGGYEIKDILKASPIFLVPVAIISVIWIMTLFPLY